MPSNGKTVLGIYPIVTVIRGSLPTPQKYAGRNGFARHTTWRVRHALWRTPPDCSGFALNHECANVIQECTR